MLATLLLLGLAGPTHAQGEAPVICLYDITHLHGLDLKDRAQRRELWDTVHLVAALQGLANRDEARLYVRFILPWDDYWFEKMRKPGEWLAGWPLERVASLEDLLARFRSVYQGAVIYDPQVPATSNVASTIAGVESLLPIRYDPSPGSLYTRLVASGKLAAKRWLLNKDGSSCFTGHGTLPDSTTASTGSIKCDPYLWAKEQYLDRGLCNPRTMAYQIDQYWLGPGGSYANHTLSNHDFFIARKGFFFDLAPWDDEPPNDDPGQKLGTDHRTLCAILRSAYDRNGGDMIHVGGFVPWAWKYTNWNGIASKHEPVPSEWRYAEVISCYNGFMDADALGNCAMANASFFQHFPLRERYPQKPRPTEDSLRQKGFLTEKGLVAPGRYVMFYVGDYDSSAWLYAEFPRCWDDPARGSVPLGWALNPNLQERMAPALHYARMTATPNDYFQAGDSGAGYLNPGGLQEPRAHSGLPSGLEAWVKHCTPYYRRWDLGITGFVIDGFSPGLNEQGLDAYARFSPEGIVAQKIGEIGVHGEMPYIRMAADLGGTPEQAAESVAERFGDLSPEFFVFRTILHPPGWHKELWDSLRQRYPEQNVQVVDPYTFFALVKRFVQRRDEHPRPSWPGDTVRWDASEGERGLRLLKAADGPFEIAEQAGRKCVHSHAEPGKIIYLYFGINDGFPPAEPTQYELTIDYLDGTGRFMPEIDAREQPYFALQPVDMQRTGQWKTLTVPVTNALFASRQNSRADFRLINFGTEVYVSRVAVRRVAR